MPPRQERFPVPDETDPQTKEGTRYNGRMRTSSVLVTGAGGEIGHGLITRLAGTGRPIVTIDLAPLDPSLSRLVRREFTGSITDRRLLERVLAEFEVDLVFHLAALLSTRSEFTPVTAHEVNVEGTLTLLEFAQHEGESHGRTVTFVYPSSIAAYGLPDLDTKMQAGRVREADWNIPLTDVRVQQALLRAPRPVLHAPLQAACGRPAVAARRLPMRALPGPHLGPDRPERRHVRLRAGNDSRRRARRGVCLLRPAGHAHPVHGDAGRYRGADAAGRRSP